MRTLKDRLTKCDSGLPLNPLMYVFLFVTFVFGLAFMLPFDFGLTQTALYVQTMVVAENAVNIWGLVALIAIVCHTIGFIVRGRIGSAFIQVAAFAGFFVWLWAGIVYLSAGLLFQFLVGAVPCIAFWIWYAWQWRRRYQGKRVAFV